MKRETTILLNVVLILILLGSLMVYSARSVDLYTSENFTGSVAPYFLLNQFVYVLIGFAVLIVAARFDYHNYAKFGVQGIIILAAVGLLVVTLFVSDDIRGGRRWISVAGYTFQASEVAKVVLVIVLAAKLAQTADRGVRFFRVFVPVLFWTAVFGGLVYMQNDLGTPIVMGATMMVLLFVAGAPIWQLGMVVVPGLAGIVFAIFQAPYRLDRVKIVFDPWSDRSNDGLQLVESLSAFARGSLWGKGFGGGEQKLSYLMDAHSDFIFAVWGEETGLIGSVALLCLFLLLLVVGRRIAMGAPDLLGTMLAAGIIFLITLQAGINMGVVTGLLPTKGLALPFISAGGSSLLANMFAVGILFNVAVQCEVHDTNRRMAAA